MDIPTVPGALYTVATKTTCDITDTATGTPIDTVSSGSVTFTAQGSVTTLSDPEASYTKVNFKTAAAALRLLGGGDQLPRGYLAAEFLETNGSQYVNIPVVCGSDAELEMTANVLSQTFANSPGLFSNEGLSGQNTSNRFNLLFNKSYYNVRADFGSGLNDVHVDGVTDNVRTYKLSKKGLFVDGVLVKAVGAEEFVGSQTRFFARKGTPIKARFFCAAIITPAQKAEFFPAIDALGVPCLYDKKSKQPFYNSGSSPFIVGLTLAQARQLSKLPAGGGSLKISLPENYTDDEAVVAALSTATENGWFFEIQTYTSDGTEASTFALRRIWVKKTADPDGAYVDATGERWHVEWCQTVLGAEPTDLGYEPIRSVDVALAEWELTPYIYPDEEP